MQLLYAVFVLFAALIGSGTSSSPSSLSGRRGVPILSQLTDIPYASNGYRPNGRLFRLPTPQQQQQQQQQHPGYVYAPPEVATTTEEVLTTTTEIPTTTEVTTEELKNSEAKELIEAKFDEEGAYYIYHPDGLLQRVVYATRSEDMGYTAKLTYKDVEPIKEPIYTYDPQTLVFSRIVL